MFQLSLQPAIDLPWTAMQPVCIGSVPAGKSTPDGYIIVTNDGEPHLRIDAWAPFHGPFTECIQWRQFAVLGWGDVVQLVDVTTLRIVTIPCDGYFRRLYPLVDRLLIASCAELISLDADGRTTWRRGGLGIDGVVVNQIMPTGVIEGEGEWDPPGGWRPFRLSLSDGRRW